MGAYAKSAGGPLNPLTIDRIVVWLRSHGPRARELAPVAFGDSALGRPLYATHCQSCHGDSQRRGPDVILTNPGFLAVASDEFIQHAMLEGRPGTAMVSFRDSLNTSEVAGIVAYLRALAQPLDANRLPAPTGREPLFAYPHGKAPEFAIKADRFIGVEQVAHALEQHRKLVIVDARPESEWMTTHIMSAVSIPYYQMKRLDEIPKDAWVIAYCACPHHLSGVVVDSLRARGRPHAYILDEGILEWERRGYPIVAAAGVPLPPAESQPKDASDR
jgi:rhodanese-related sulfurtransferase/mono/diheme cytochrome c family protein